MGLGAIAVKAQRITDAMFQAAARALALQVSPEDLAQGSLYPGPALRDDAGQPRHRHAGLHVTPEPGTVAVLPVCSVTKLGTAPKLLAIAQRCSTQVQTVDAVQCCSFASERGFMRPELNEHALRHLRQSLPSDCRTGYATSRTCEIGLSEMSGQPYQSILYLLERCSAGPQTASPPDAPPVRT